MQINESALISRFLESLAGLVRQLTLLDRNEKVCLGLTFSQCNVLQALLAQSSCSMSGLTERLGLAMCTLTRILDNLVRDGFVARTRHETDGRKVALSLSTKGRQTAEQINECIQANYLRLFSALPMAKRTHVTESLHILNQTLAGTAWQCCRSSQGEN